VSPRAVLASVHPVAKEAGQDHEERARHLVPRRRMKYSAHAFGCRMCEKTNNAEQDDGKNLNRSLDVFSRSTRSNAPAHDRARFRPHMTEAHRRT